MEWIKGGYNRVTMKDNTSETYLGGLQDQNKQYLVTLLLENYLCKIFKQKKMFLNVNWKACSQTE